MAVADTAGLQAFFSDFFKDQAMLKAHFPSTDAGEMGWLPEADVRDEAEEVIFHLALPGVEKRDIRLQAGAGLIVVSGRRLPRQGQGSWLLQEIVSGPFERRLPLPAGVRVELATASHRDGVLEIRVPKQSEAERVVEIQ